MEALFHRVKETPWEERKKISGLSAERADIIVAGMAIIMELMEYTRASSMIVSGCGLREGAIFFSIMGPTIQQRSMGYHVFKKMAL